MNRIRSDANAENAISDSIEEMNCLTSWVIAVRRANLLLVTALLTRKVEIGLYLILMNLGIIWTHLDLKRKFWWITNRECHKCRLLRWLISNEFIITRRKVIDEKLNKNTDTQKHKLKQWKRKGKIEINNKKQI